MKEKESLTSKKLIELELLIAESLQSMQIGLQNVYNKFSELEGRQISIEQMLKSERIIDVIKAIPTEENIDYLIKKIDMISLRKLNERFSQLEDELRDILNKIS